MQLERRRCLLPLRHLLGSVVWFRDPPGTMYSLLDMLLSLWTTAALPESTKHSFPFLFPPASFLLCSSLPLWFAFKLLSLCCDCPPHICPHSSFPAPHMSHEGRSDRGATVLWQSKLFSCPAPVIRQRCKCQLKCQHRAGPPFISAFWRNSLLRSAHKTLSWDRVHFNPFVLLFFLIPYRGNGKLESVRELLLRRENLPWNSTPNLGYTWGDSGDLISPYLGFTGYSWSHPKDYELVFRNQIGFFVWNLQIWICCITSVFDLNVLNWFAVNH